MSRMRGEHLRSVGDLLQKYRTLRAPQGTVITSFLLAVQTVCKFELKKHAVKYNPHAKAVFLILAGPAKHEILLHTNEILQFCVRDIGAENAPRSIG